MFRTSYLTKLTLFGCMLCTLPVILLGILSYAQARQEIQKQVERGQVQLLIQMKSNVDQTLQTIYHSFNQLALSTIMQKVFEEPMTAHNFLLYNDLRREILNTQSNYNKLDDIVLVNFDDNWIIKNTGFTDLDSYSHLPELQSLMALPDRSSWVLNPTSWFYMDGTPASRCPYTVSLVRKQPERSLAKKGQLYANISACTISKLLNFTPSDAESVIILDEHNRIIYHSDASKIGRDAGEAGYIPDPSQLTEMSGRYKVSVGGRSYSANYMKSDFNRWTYISVLSISSLTRDSKKIGNYTLVICLALAGVFLLIAWRTSRQMYHPVRRLLKQSEGQEPPRSGKDPREFELIGARLHELSRSKDKLERETLQYVQQARSFFLVKLYQGRMRRSEMMEKMEMFGFTDQLAGWKKMTVLTVQIDTLENTAYGKEDRDLLLFAVHNMVEEIIPAAYRLPPVVVEITLVVLLGWKSDGGGPIQERLYEWTETIQQQVHRLLGLAVSIGISLPFEDPKLASRAYQEGLEALRHRMHLGERVIIPYSAVNQGRHQVHLDYPHLTESELFDAIVLADEVRARLLLKQFVTNVFKHDLGPKEYQVLMVRLLNNLMVRMQESGIPLNRLQAGGTSLYEELGTLQMTAEIESWFWSSVISGLIALYRERQDSQYRSISEEVITLIHARYDTDLTIEQCASELHYNANYLSGVFRKETNLTFSEYLILYRFQQAKIWLKETSMPVKEISDKLRYLNPQSFIRSFKRQEGITPGQYREQFKRLV
ncbi:AraC family transcriptional regulator [Gorillibacterium sp. sgz5001074]|uniref:AraC family transcriptional regulator n=1 Tax=Gorillibacterium sp. sgz5001074 TaxID=3446695 RepID=UPI003F6637BA